MKLPVFIWCAAKWVMEPLERHRDRCVLLDDGAQYILVEIRSLREHNQFFAVAAEAFAQFPEEITGPIVGTFQTVESRVHKFRAESLIECGFCTEQRQNWHDIGMAAIAAATLAKYNPYSRVEALGSVLKLSIPESMSVDHTGQAGGMTAARFRRAKKACFEYWAHTIGITVEELVENAKAERHAA